LTFTSLLSTKLGGCHPTHGKHSRTNSKLDTEINAVALGARAVGSALTIRSTGAEKLSALASTSGTTGLARASRATTSRSALTVRATRAVGRTAGTQLLVSTTLKGILRGRCRFKAHVLDGGHQLLLHALAVGAALARSFHSLGAVAGEFVVAGVDFGRLAGENNRNARDTGDGFQRGFDGGGATTAHHWRFGGEFEVMRRHGGGLFWVVLISLSYEDWVTILCWNE